MTICTIYHSYSGITRGIAEKVSAACGGDAIEITPNKPYSKITAYSLGCMRAMREEADPVSPESIDLSGYDLAVIGTPVWAWKATPPINGAIAALSGCEGKKAVLFATCGARSGETLNCMKKALEAKGVLVVGEFSFNRKEVADEERINALISAVKAAAGE